MENMDGINQQEVWQRILARPDQPRGESLRSLMLSAMELLSCYRYLANTLTGKARDRAKQLYDGELENIGCLRGIGQLSGSGDEVLKIWNPSKEPAAKLLEKCYHRTRRCQMEYMARSAEPEFGVVFQNLADREAENCVRIAQLLGLLGR